MRRGPGIASLSLIVVILLAAGALAYGALHDGSRPHGFGTANQQAAARRTLILLTTPGLVADNTFTACGSTADACFTGTGNITQTLTSLSSAVRAAGGRLANTCAVLPADPTDTSGYSCSVEGRLDGAWLVVLVGDSWLLPSRPGLPAPKSAALVGVETNPADPPLGVAASLPAQAPDVHRFVPSTWLAPTDACVSLPAAVGSVQPSAAPLPDCPAHTASVRVATTSTIVAASNELAQVSLKAGFRVSGLPCAIDSRQSSCHFVADRRGSSAGVLLHEHLEATLNVSSDGNVGGTLSLTDLT